MDGRTNGWQDKQIERQTNKEREREAIICEVKLLTLQMRLNDRVKTQISQSLPKDSAVFFNSQETAGSLEKHHE
jgi:hypothetical protein